MRIRFPRLYAISDSRAAGNRAHREIVRELLAGGARWVQIRAKDAPAGEFLAEVRACVDLARPAGARVMVNDRPDIARLARAAGVHLGGGDLPPGTARGVLAPGSLVGVSTHSEPEAVDLAPGADYVAIGPIFPSPTAKRDWSPLGLEVVRRLRGRLPVPLVAIGGIRLEDAAAVLEAGADAIAVISDLYRGETIRGRVAEFLRRLGG
ncbi:MAG: thiamine phosphate synthase [Acidobacteria bacterium]|nr:thiamine phosphate synthase [Acidobacteriota bacterium]